MAATLLSPPSVIRRTVAAAASTVWTGESHPPISRHADAATCCCTTWPEVLEGMQRLDGRRIPLLRMAKMIRLRLRLRLCECCRCRPSALMKMMKMKRDIERETAVRPRLRRCRRSCGCEMPLLLMKAKMRDATAGTVALWLRLYCRRRPSSDAL